MRTITSRGESARSVRKVDGDVIPPLNFQTRVVSYGLGGIDKT